MTEKIKRMLLTGGIIFLLGLCFLLGRRKTEESKFQITVKKNLPLLEDSTSTQEEIHPKDAYPKVVHVFVKSSDTLQDMAVEEYLLGVLSGEMRPQWPMDALKAQAIAARSYVLHKCRALGGKGCSKGGDICTFSGHCMAFLSEEERKNRWGRDFSSYEARIRQAVYETKGQVLTYKGEIIHALFHASSGGRTEDVYTVYQMKLPYLQSVESPEEKGMRTSYEEEKSWTKEEWIKVLKEKWPKMNLTVKGLEKQVKNILYTPSGRIDTMNIGGQTINGKELRSLLSLRSTYITLTFTQNEVKIKTKGYGHGVGLSQAGAYSMAQKGKNYREILLHYYPGTQISTRSAG